MAREYRISFDGQAAEGFIRGLSLLNAESVGNATVDAVNNVAAATYQLARERMIAGINLSDEYLRQRMRLEPATAQRPEASIIASGARSDLSVLGRFNAQPKVVNNKAAGRRKGNRALGISPGQRQLGVTVEVSRGSPKDFQRGFLLPLRKGTEAGGNGFGVFARNRSGRLIHRYGPSVYQLFDYQVQKLGTEVADDLETSLNTQIDAVLNKAFE